MTNSKINPLSDKMSIVRIAPVCNGKIYVVQRRPDGVKTPRLDLPIEEHLEHFSPNSEKYIYFHIRDVRELRQQIERIRYRTV